MDTKNKNVFVVCYNISSAKSAFDDSLRSFQRVFGGRVVAKYRYLLIETPDIRMQFISSEASNEVAVGKIIHSVVFHCDEWKVAYYNPPLYRELIIRRSREGFPFEFTLAHTIFQ